VANTVARRVRPAGAWAGLAALVISVLVSPSAASAAPPKPTVGSVQNQLNQLAVQNSQLVEKFNQAQVAVTKGERQAAGASRTAKQAASTYSRLHGQFVQIVQSQYENRSFGAASALLESNSGPNYLDRLATLDMVTTHTAQVVGEVGKARADATQASAKADQLLSSAKDARTALGAKRVQVQKRIDKYRGLLSNLTAAQQAAYERATSPSVNGKKMHLTAAGTGAARKAVKKMHLTAAGTGAARKAVQFALDQVGKRYVFAAAGPSAFDCSGLTMRAWQRGGVSLPHSAAGQYGYGHHVARNALQPGDLVFFYQPIGHVAIYIGNGLMVSASTESRPISVEPLGSAGSYTGATRLA